MTAEEQLLDKMKEIRKRDPSMYGHIVAMIIAFYRLLTAT